MARKITTTRLALALCAAGMVGATAASATVLPDYDIVRTYRDAPDGATVGVYIINCLGAHSMMGVTSPYFDEIRTPC